MLTISGKSIITSDWHFGVRRNDLKFASTLSNALKKTNGYASENSVDNLIFCGDLFHNRNILSVDTINIAIKCMERVSKTFKHVYIILGNHDIFNKFDTKVHSSIMFRNLKNITIIDKPEICDINGKRCLLAPWLTDMSVYENESFDMIFGHFEISHDYMINSFIENCRSRKLTNDEIKKEIERDELFRDDDMEALNIEADNKEETYLNRKKSSELIGNWVDKAKVGSPIFAGHIHNHREFYTKGRKFIFIGSPYQQTRSEIGSIDGFYVLEENGNYKFVELEGIPIFIDIVMSKVVNNIDKYDFSKLTGNVIHKIYDIDIDPKINNIITQKIIDSNPFYELDSDYELAVTADKNVSESVDLLRKKKLDYLMMYIHKMDDALFDEETTKDNLMETMKYYYDMAGGEN